MYKMKQKDCPKVTLRLSSGGLDVCLNAIK